MDRLTPFSFRVLETERAAIHRAAEKAGLSDSEWARLILSAAAGSSELPEQLIRVVTIRTRKGDGAVRDGKW